MTIEPSVGPSTTMRCASRDITIRAYLNLATVYLYGAVNRTSSRWVLMAIS
jgi:hypothetical protein